MTKIQKIGFIFGESSQRTVPHLCVTMLIRITVGVLRGYPVGFPHFLPAMEAEADPFVQRLQLKRDETMCADPVRCERPVLSAYFLTPTASHCHQRRAAYAENKPAFPRRLPAQLPCICYSGEYGGASICVVINGEESKGATARFCRPHLVSAWSLPERLRFTVDVLAGKDPVYLVDSVGTVPAALATFSLLQGFRPDILINAGTAGGFKVQHAPLPRAEQPGSLLLGPAAVLRSGDRDAVVLSTFLACAVTSLPCATLQAQGGSVGDVYLGSAARHHDRHIQMPVYDKYGVYELACQLTPKLREVRARRRKNRRGALLARSVE